MGYAMNELPKKVAKLVSKLADIQRKNVEIMRSAAKGEKTEKELNVKIDEQYEKSMKVVEELFSTQFAVVEIGVGFSEEDSFADDLHMVGLYFIERYALDRMICKISGDKPDEDLLDAGTWLLHQSLMADSEDGFFGGYEEEERMPWEEEISIDDSLRNENKQPDGKIVQMFGEKKGKKK
jgi:hypothetical protein